MIQRLETSRLQPFACALPGPCGYWWPTAKKGDRRQQIPGGYRANRHIEPAEHLNAGAVPIPSRAFP